LGTEVPQGEGRGEGGCAESGEGSGFRVFLLLVRQVGRSKVLWYRRL
jgi:hypothetical protein